MNGYHFSGIGLVACLCMGLVLSPSVAEEPLRVVPQLGWGDVGLASPDGSLFATGIRQYGSHSIKLVSKQGNLLWAIPPYPLDAAFSPDGKWLAACGIDDGWLLDLKSCKLQTFPAFRGLLIAFTPDSQKVLVVRRSPYERDRAKEPVDEGLFVYDLNTRQTARFPVGMDVPQVLEVQPDGKTVRVRGAHGNPMSHFGGSMGKAEETIHLDTGKTERDWGPLVQGRTTAADSGAIERIADPPLAKLPPVDAKKSVPQGLGEFWWNEVSGLCVHAGAGTKAWDIRGAQFLGTLGTEDGLSEISGFLGPDAILAHAWENHKQYLSLVDVRSGRIVTTRLPLYSALPSPDGKSILVQSNPRKEQENRLVELFHVPPGEPFYSEASDFHARRVWSGNGQYVACLRPRSAGPGVRIISAADGKFVEIALADVIASHTTGKDRPPPIWVLVLDDSGDQLAAGMGWTDSGFFAVASRKTGRVETVIDGLPKLVHALQFIGPDRLLTGTMSGRVQLWDLHRRQPLWTTETNQEPLQFGYIPGGPYVVCGHFGRSGTVLRLEDGKIMYKTRPLRSGGDSNVLLPWTQPQLIGRGLWALEMDPESMQVRLVEIATGRVALTYCALPDSQWIIYTPSGDWDGSDHIHDWVKFFDGLKPVAPQEADRRHRRQAIQAVAKQVFSDSDPKDNKRP